MFASMLPNMDATLSSLNHPHFGIGYNTFQVKSNFQELSSNTGIVYFENTTELQVLETNEDEVAEILLQLKKVKVVVPGESGSESEHEQPTSAISSTSTTSFSSITARSRSRQRISPTSTLRWRSTTSHVEPEAATQNSSDSSSSESSHSSTKKREREYQNSIIVKRSKSLDGLSAILSSNGGSEDIDVDRDMEGENPNRHQFSRTQCHSDEDYFQEDDDEEWMEIKPTSPSIPLSPSLSPFKGSVEYNDDTLPQFSLNSAQRKKAPSGSACDKHKRWKKRCPEDCPMRRRKSSSFYLQNGIKEEEGKQIRDQKDQIARLMDESIKYIDLHDLEKSAKSLVKIVSLLELNTSLHSFVEPLSKTASVIIIRSSLERLDSNIDALDEFGIDLKEELYKRLNVIEQEGSDELRKGIEGGIELEVEGDNEKAPVSVYPKDIARRSLNRREDDFIYEDEVLEDDVEFEGQESGAYKYKGQEQSKTVQKNRGKYVGRGKVRSKYLPQACDRHKLLHARCPANCPDRLKRDSLGSIATPTTSTPRSK